MNYYETMMKANKHNISAIDLMIAEEVNAQLGETLIDVMDDEKDKINKFEKICNLTWEVYKRTDEITLQHIVSTIIEIFYDGTNTIDTITRKLIIERL